MYSEISYQRWLFFRSNDCVLVEEILRRAVAVDECLSIVAVPADRIWE